MGRFVFGANVEESWKAREESYTKGVIPYILELENVLGMYDENWTLLKNHLGNKSIQSLLQITPVDLMDKYIDEIEKR